MGRINPSRFRAGCFGPRAPCEPGMIYSSPSQRTEQPPVFSLRHKAQGGFALLSPPRSLAGPVQLCRYLYIIQCKQRTSEATVRHRRAPAATSHSLPGKAMELAKHSRKILGSLPRVPGSPWESVLRNYSAKSHALLLPPALPEDTSQHPWRAASLLPCEPPVPPVCCVFLQHFQGTGCCLTLGLLQVTPHSHTNAVQEGLQLLRLTASC